MKGGRGEKKGGREKVGVFGQETFTAPIPTYYEGINRHLTVLNRIVSYGGINY